MATTVASENFLAYVGLPKKENKDTLYRLISNVTHRDEPPPQISTNGILLQAECVLPTLAAPPCPPYACASPGGPTGNSEERTSPHRVYRLRDVNAVPGRQFVNLTLACQSLTKSTGSSKVYFNNNNNTNTSNTTTTTSVVVRHWLWSPFEPKLIHVQSYFSCRLVLLCF